MQPIGGITSARRGLPQLVGVDLAVGGEPSSTHDAGRVQQFGWYHLGVELELGDELL